MQRLYMERIRTKRLWGNIRDVRDFSLCLQCKNPYKNLLALSALIALFTHGFCSLRQCTRWFP